MAGYNHELGMSNNAVKAYEKGLIPLSGLTSTIVEKVELDISSFPLRFYKWLAKVQYWNHKEWHHMSCNYTKVLFYDIEELGVLLRSTSIEVLAQWLRKWATYESYHVQ